MEWLAEYAIVAGMEVISLFLLKIQKKRSKAEALTFLRRECRVGF